MATLKRRKSLQLYTICKQFSGIKGMTPLELKIKDTSAPGYRSVRKPFTKTNIFGRISFSRLFIRKKTLPHI